MTERTQLLPFLWLLGGLAVGCAGPLPAPGPAPRRDAATATRAQRLAAELRALGGEASTGDPAQGEPLRGAEALADGLFGPTTPPPEEIDATFGRYCRRTGAPRRERMPGFVRVTYTGVERRSGAECLLVTDLPRAGRWRFVLRIKRADR